MILTLPLPPPLPDVPLPVAPTLVIASHLADVASTEYCLHAIRGCREYVLPKALVSSTPAFTAYSLGTALLEIEAQRVLARRGKGAKKLAFTLQMVNVSLTFATSVSNLTAHPTVKAGAQLLPKGAAK